MADATLFLGDAGHGASAVGGAKGRSEAGGGKGHADIANDQGEGFEQILAKGNKSRDGDAETNADTATSGSRVRGLSVRWPQGSEPTDEDGARAGATEDGTSTGSLREADLESEDASQADRTTKAAQEPVPDVSSHLVGAAPTGGGARQARDASAIETSRQANRVANDVAVQANQAASRNPAGPILPGAVQPAVAQLTAVLSQGRETGKRDVAAQRGPMDVPAKINVSLAETHFSPVKPDSELEAYDLARRADGRGAQKDLGKSARDVSRMQAEVRSDKAGRSSTLTQTDVRAEQIAQSVARSASGDVSGQIGTRILQELEHARPLSETRSSGQVHVKQSDPVLKVLEIKLEPRDLGSVVVRMSLRNDVLNVELGFGRSEAAATIAKNTDQLTHYLRSSGYVVDEVVVRVVEGDHRVHSQMTTTATTGADPTHAQGEAGNSATSSGLTGQSFGEQGERRPAAGGQNPSSQHGGEGTHDQDNSQSRSRGGVFV